MAVWGFSESDRTVTETKVPYQELHGFIFDQKLI